MPKYNTEFTLDLNDMNLIEAALRFSAKSQAEHVDPVAANNLLGRLHNQKNFYRPKDGIYVSG
jgi:hypothetical protein